MLAPLPSSHGAFIHPKPSGQRPLAKAEKTPGQPEPSGEVVARFGLVQPEGTGKTVSGDVGNVTQEVDDGGQVPVRRAGPVSLPVCDRGLVNADPRSYLPLLKL